MSKHYTCPACADARLDLVHGAHCSALWPHPTHYECPACGQCYDIGPDGPGLPWPTPGGMESAKREEEASA